MRCDIGREGALCWCISEAERGVPRRKSAFVSRYYRSAIVAWGTIRSMGRVRVYVLLAV